MHARAIPQLRFVGLELLVRRVMQGELNAMPAMASRAGTVA